MQTKSMTALQLGQMIKKKEVSVKEAVQETLLHGAVGYKVFPINTLAAKREEDLSGNGAAARPFSRRKAPCLLCLCKRK